MSTRTVLFGGFGIVLSFVAGGCEFDEAVGTEGCAPNGSTRRGEVCADGRWIPVEDASDGADGTDEDPDTVGDARADSSPVDSTDGGPTDTGRDTGGEVDTGMPPVDTAGDVRSDVTDVGDTASPDTSDTGGAMDGGDVGDVTCPGSAGCPCNFNTLGAGVCGRATTDGSGECRRPGGFEYAESSCNDGKDNDCDGKTDGADPDCSGSPPAAQCSSAGDCTSGLCVQEPPPSAGPPDYYCAHRIFVTSASWDGSLGGPNGADEKCKRLANRAKLNGEWEAVVSTDSADANDRIDLGLDEPVHNLAPGSNDRVFEGAGEMWGLGDSLQNAIRYDENGQSVGGEVWTGTGNIGFTQRDGWTPQTCGDWTSNAPGDDGVYGESSSTGDVDWVDKGERSCDRKLHLYCIDGQ